MPDGQNSIGGIAASTTKMDWSQWDPWGGLRGAAAVALLLGLGFLLHQTAAGAIAAGGALSLGMGSFTRQSFKSIPVLLGACFFMGLSTLAGTWTGGWGLGFSLIIGLWGFGGGLLVAADTALWFVGLKGVVMLLIAGGFPSTLPHALERGALVLLGGLVQTLFLSAEYHLMNWGGRSRMVQEPTPPFLKALQGLSEHFHLGSAAFRHALRLAVALILGQELGRYLFTHNAYWLPVTVAIVLRPDFSQTLTRGLSRVGGTLVGAGFTSLIVAVTKPSHPVLMVLGLVFTWCAFMFFRVNYALYAVFITGYVVFMLSFAGLPEMEVVEYRLLATLLGGTLAMLVYLAWPTKN